MRVGPIGGNVGRTKVGLLDGLVVRHDVACHGGPPLMPFVVMMAIMAVTYPVVVVSHARPLGEALIAVLLMFIAWLVAAFIRVLYGAANPYLSPSWLATARAAFGDEVMNPALEQLRGRRSPDDVLWRRDVIEAVIIHRQDLKRACKAARGVRLRDAMGQG